MRGGERRQAFVESVMKWIADTNDELHMVEEMSPTKQRSQILNPILKITTELFTSSPVASEKSYLAEQRMKLLKDRISSRVKDNWHAADLPI